MEMIIEEILIYSAVALLCFIIVYFYLRKQIRQTKLSEEKIKLAKESGVFEPISLHPVVDVNSCIKSEACISACPEKDILGIVNGKATTINASECIGHGACFHACPVEAITLCIGTEERGVDLPHVNQNFESNIPGIYIAGELGGMGLIKNAVEQGKQAVEHIFNSRRTGSEKIDDILIIGAGPAGIAAALMAKKLGLSFKIVDQETLGGTVSTFPRAKVVMTNPMEIPLYGKVKLFETSKNELIELWIKVLTKNNIQILEKKKIESIVQDKEGFIISSASGQDFKALNVVLAIGRRGTPRKLNVAGETLQKVAYRLLEPENIFDKDIFVVGGGDSAIESALLLADQNRVHLSYRGDKFKRLKVKNREKIQRAEKEKKVNIIFNSNIQEIKKDDIALNIKDSAPLVLKNDLVYIFAGGELPSSFLEKTGIQITKRFGYALMKH